jgi:hypothetical protein
MEKDRYKVEEDIKNLQALRFDEPLVMNGTIAGDEEIEQHALWSSSVAGSLLEEVADSQSPELNVKTRDMER